MSMYHSTVASDPNIRGAKPIPVLVAMAPVPVQCSTVKRYCSEVD